MSVRATLESDPVGLVDRVAAANSSAPETKAAPASSFHINWQAELASNNSEDELSEATTTSIDQKASTELLPVSSGSPTARTASSASMGVSAAATSKSSPANLITDLRGSSKAVKKNPRIHDFMQLNSSDTKRKESFRLRGYRTANESGQGSVKDRTQNEFDQQRATSFSPVLNEISFQLSLSPAAIPQQNEFHIPTAITQSPHLDKVAVASITLVEQQSEGPNLIPTSVIGTPAGSDPTNDVRAITASDNPLTTDRISKAESDAEPKAAPALPERISGLATADQKAIRNSELSEYTGQRNSVNDLSSNADTLQSAGSGWSPGSGDQLKAPNAQANSIPGNQSQTLTSETTPNGDYGWAPSSPRADSPDPMHDPDRYASQLGESQTPQSNAGLSALTGTSALAKRTSSRIASNLDHAQSLKQAMPGPSDAFVPHSFAGSRVSELAEAGNVTPKSTGAASNDVRMQATFTALESGSRAENGAFGWSRGSHTLAEAGYQDPVLGWVGVRAETIGGMVHATLVPPSQDAAQALSGHMAGLHTYLAENHTPVETLNLASFGKDSQDLTQNAGQGMQHGTDQHADHGNASERELDSRSSSHGISRGAPRTTSISNEAPALSSAGRNSMGTHISVMA